MKRRDFLISSAGTSILAGLSMSGFSCGSAPPPIAVEADILIKNGHVIDPANNIDNKMDAAVKDGVITRIAQNISTEKAGIIIDATGKYVTPGFIDIHAHVFYTDKNPSYRWVIADDLCYPAGVTTVVDPGSSGALTFEKLKTEVIDTSKTRTLALINIAAPGMTEAEQDPSQFDIDLAVTTAEKYPEVIIGFKTAHYWTSKPYDDIHTPWASVDAVAEAGRRASLPVMYDFFPRRALDGYPERSYRELISEKMKPGDIHTHCYARHIPVLDENGKINKDILRAQESGRIFDLGHGAGSFVYRNAVPAFEQGYYPNTISTDLHNYNTCGPVVDMLNVMSKIRSMGMPLFEVIRRSTINPARVINRSDLGTLSEGSTADISIFEELTGEFTYLDTSGGKLNGNKMFRQTVTIAGGEVAYDPYGLSFPFWKNIPKDNTYWENPSGQTY